MVVNIHHEAALTENERVEVCCEIAREKLEVGDYDGGIATLQPWWEIGEWPNHSGLTNKAAAELLLTAGVLSGLIASTKQSAGGLRPAEELLSGAIALFEQMGDKARAAEGRIELGWCYFWHGLFDLARLSLCSSLTALTENQTELRSIGLIRLAVVEHYAGRLHDAIALLTEASPLVETECPWIKGRFHLEYATTLRDLGVAEANESHYGDSLKHYQEALLEFERLGNLRYTAIVENNLGYLLLTLHRFDEADAHLQRAKTLFEQFGDAVKRAQVEETVAQLLIARGEYYLAESSIQGAVETLEDRGEDALLAEALTTQGLVLCRLGRRQEAKPILERARRVAERCGDREGA
ncbi:MAG TPA: tetratricopeptide repeat protein, partial [Pyrinomonadaceae bacterium]|nr:tetratricopeptide repeat protein [Pyrinomonadaceae bacterium]